MATFQKASEAEPGILDIYEDMMETHHNHLAKAGVLVEFLVAYGKVNEDGEIVGIALKHHGDECDGLCKKITHENRVAGLADARIVINGDTWRDKTIAEKRDLVDHEMYHIELVVDERGVVFDDGNRPKLVLRTHDRKLGSFDDVTARHGSASTSVQFMKQLVDEVGQVYFPWMGLPDPVAPKVRKGAEASPDLH